MGEPDEPPLRTKSWSGTRSAETRSPSKHLTSYQHNEIDRSSSSRVLQSDGGIESTTGHGRPSRNGSSGPQFASPFAGYDSHAQGEVTGVNEKETPSTSETSPPKGPMGTRMKNGIIRFGGHTKRALFHSWVNVLLIFVPIGIAVNFAGLAPAVVFAMNAVAIVPLAGLLSHATESVAKRLGDTWGALLNVSFGNAVELIIFIIALAKNEIRIVQASILGSILANLLLILGMAFFLGGLRFQEQIYNSTVTQMSACLLSLSVMSLLLPTAFHASWADQNDANNATLKVSRGTSVILLTIYVLYILFQLKSHAYLYQSMPQQIIDEESHPGILQHVLNSSSSSSSSDSSSDTDSDTTHGSHNTAKRFKRAFRRKRRKSSASSKSMPSRPSTAASHPNSHHPAGLNPVLSGDEADGEDVPVGGSVSRDFGETGPSKPPSDRKLRRKFRRHRHKKHQKNAPSDTGDATDVVRENAPSASGTSAQQHQVKEVTFVREQQDEQAVAEQRLQAQREKVTSNNPFNLRSMRPPMPKMLSQNVFVNPPVVAGSPNLGPRTASSRASPTVPMGPRRVRSLPENMHNIQGTSNVSAGATSAPLSRATTLRLAPCNSTPAGIDHEEEEEPNMSRTAAVVLLLISTGLVAFCAELMVDVIPKMTAHSSVSQTFIGLIILPIVGNAAEHVTAVTVAAKNKMDLAIGVAVGSSIQIALFVTPIVILLGWIMDKDMTLYFNIFETVSLFVTVFVVNFLVLDGRSNYLEGALLMGAYIIIAVAAFFYPGDSAQSEIGGNGVEDASVQASKMLMMMFK